jgi:uncharacterized iron-regulated protein
MCKNALILFCFLSLTPLIISAQKSSKNAEIKKAAIIASNPQPYIIYNSEGEIESFNSIVKAALETDVVLFGELHDNPIVHWLQYLLTLELDIEIQDLVLGAEMFETDDQLPLNEYLSGVINLSKLEGNTRVWPNFKTDYLPLVNYAKDNNHKFIATNVPRRYASFVYHNGLDTLEYLSDKAKSFLPPLPIAYDGNLGCYKEMLEMSGGHGGDNLPKSQALKDACMAHNILINIPSNGVFLHYNGAFHSKNKEGITWYLLHENPDLKIMTIDATEQEFIDELEEERMGVADFIIVTPLSLTKTH